MSAEVAWPSVNFSDVTVSKCRMPRMEQYLAKKSFSSGMVPDDEDKSRSAANKVRQR